MHAEAATGGVETGAATVRWEAIAVGGDGKEGGRGNLWGLRGAKRKRKVAGISGWTDR
jgi:hypothetical protein